MRWQADFDFNKLQIFAKLAREGMVRSPNKCQQRINLARLLIQLGAYSEAEAGLYQARDRFPDSPEIPYLIAVTLKKRGCFHEAAIMLDTVIEKFSENSEEVDFYLKVLSRLNRLDNVKLFQGSSSPHLFHRDIKSLEPQAALAFCDKHLAVNPRHIEARYFKAVILAALGENEAACAVISVDRLIDIQDLPVPSSYADGQAFRAALVREIRANRTLVKNPQGTTTRDGWQTNVLRQPGAQAVEDLLSSLRAAVDGYLRRQGDSDFVKSAPTYARLSPWAVIYGRQGRQLPHIHSNGWLSGVYYGAAPRSDAEDAYSGATIIGSLSEKAEGFGPLVPPWGTRAVEPVPGRLVLFPSYVPHSTLPSGVEGARVVVAFDVVPVAT